MLPASTSSDMRITSKPETTTISSISTVMEAIYIKSWNDKEPSHKRKHCKHSDNYSKLSKCLIDITSCTETSNPKISSSAMGKSNWEILDFARDSNLGNTWLKPCLGLLFIWLHRFWEDKIIQWKQTYGPWELSFMKCCSVYVPINQNQSQCWSAISIQRKYLCQLILTPFHKKLSSWWGNYWPRIISEESVG